MFRTTMFIVLVLISEASFAHPGGLDANGGHHDHRSGGYHFHGGGGFDFMWVQPDYEVTTPSPRTTARTSARKEARKTARHKDRRSQLAEEFKPIKPAPTRTLSDEEVAAAKLRLAKQLLKQGKLSVAVHRLNEIVTDYPQTSAAIEAKDLIARYEGQRK